MSGDQERDADAKMFGQSVVEFRILRLERDHEQIRIEFREHRENIKTDMQLLEKRIVEEIQETREAVRQGRDGLGKAFERAMLVIVALLSALGVYFHAH